MICDNILVLYRHPEQRGERERETLTGTIQRSKPASQPVRTGRLVCLRLAGHTPTYPRTTDRSTFSNERSRAPPPRYDQDLSVPPPHQAKLTASPSTGGPSASSVESSLSDLSLNKAKAKVSSSTQSKTKTAIADSWEDDDDESSEPSTPTGPTPSSANHPHSQAPPPTPASPGARFDNPYAIPLDFGAAAGSGGTSRAAPDKRPDKTTSAASRMIAGALGVRAPRKAQEMKDYESAAVAKERARRDREKEESDEAERRKRSVWEE